MNFSQVCVVKTFKLSISTILQDKNVTNTKIYGLNFIKVDFAMKFKSISYIFGPKIRYFLNSFISY